MSMAIGQAASNIAGAGLGLLLEGHNDRRQYFQQKKLQELQIAGQKEMGRYNQGLALDMWNKTNYEAQRRHMEAAGLNVGLMYGTAGQGGSTQTPTGSVSGGSAEGQKGEIGMGLQLGMQTAMQQAQIELTKAQTEKTNVEAEKIAGVDTRKTGQEIKNLEVQSVILNHEEKIKEIAARVQKGTEEEQLEELKNQNDKTAAEARSAAIKAGVDQATQNEAVKQIRAKTIEQQLNIAATKAGIINVQTQTAATQKGIEQMAATINNMTFEQRMQWEKWGQAEKERWIKEKQLELNKQGVEFNTGGAAETKRWTEVITDIMKVLPK